MTETTETELLTEQWTHVGVRIASDKTRCSAWLDSHGRTLLFADRHTYVIGGVYEVKCRRDNGHVMRGSLPEYTRQRGGTAEDRAEWEALDLVAKTQLATMSAERKAKNRSELEEAMMPLLAIAVNLKTADDRDAFAAYILRRVNTAWMRGSLR